MHELGITRNIVAIAADAAAGRRVTKVTLAVGELAGVMPDAIAFCFDIVARGSPIDGATLEIWRIEGRGRCDECGRELATPTLYTQCECGCRAVTRLAGEELLVKAIEMEDD